MFNGLCGKHNLPRTKIGEQCHFRIDAVNIDYVKETDSVLHLIEHYMSV